MNNYSYGLHKLINIIRVCAKVNQKVLESFFPPQGPFYQIQLHFILKQVIYIGSIIIFLFHPANKNELLQLHAFCKSTLYNIYVILIIYICDIDYIYICDID